MWPLHLHKTGNDLTFDEHFYMYKYPLFLKQFSKLVIFIESLQHAWNLGNEKISSHFLPKMRIIAIVYILYLLSEKKFNSIINVVQIPVLFMLHSLDNSCETRAITSESHCIARSYVSVLLKAKNYKYNFYIRN
jgi:hypothetical protein